MFLFCVKALTIITVCFTSDQKKVSVLNHDILWFQFHNLRFESTVDVSKMSFTNVINISLYIARLKYHVHRVA